MHRARAHLKVPGWSLIWNELLTKKLPMFLSRLNEVSGGCEKMSKKDKELSEISQVYFVWPSVLSLIKLYKTNAVKIFVYKQN